MKRILIGLVRGYQLLFSAWVGGQCRFTPTCSNYAIEALRRHGAGRGAYLGTVRILRCQPWCRGGHDPVPEVFGWRAWVRDEADASQTPEKSEQPVKPDTPEAS